MWKKVLKVLLTVIVCWAVFVAIEGIRLVGSTDPGKYPLLRLGGSQHQGEHAIYQSLGFSQEYQLTEGDSFVSGQFKVLGIPVAKWDSSDS